MSAEVVSLKLRPIIRVQRWTVGWLVTVRPAPEGVASCRNFDTEDEAAEYATALQVEHGWRIRPDRYGQTPMEAA